MQFLRGSNKAVYVDYNATAPLRPGAKFAVLDVLEEPGNPSSVHSKGRKAKSIVEKARTQVSQLINCEPDNIIFTSGGTEADILALRGSGCQHILISSIEHDAVLSAVPKSIKIPVLANGILDIESLRSLVHEASKPFLVSIMWANNETGAIQPIADAKSLVSEAGGFMHVDAVQALGKIPLDFLKSCLDMMSISAHKIGGPPGVGALIIREGFDLRPIFLGGGQEKGRRSGTENVSGIAGFGAAAQVCLNSPNEIRKVTRLRNLFEASILANAPDAQIICKDVERLGNTSAVFMPGISAETQVMAFDLEGVAVSAGAACSSGKVKESHVLRAMKLNDETINNTIRVSFGWENTEADVDRLVKVWLNLYKSAKI